MEEEVTGSGGGRGKKMGLGEVELKEKAGTAWSHSYLNQKPWHPLSYPNQRRKWIAEQIHANRARRQEEVQREFAQEQEFFRQTALFSKKDKEKVQMEVMKSVSFMYVRPPGYNAESAKAAEIEDEKKKTDPGDMTGAAAASTSSMPDKGHDKVQSGSDKKNRPKDVFGRPLPTEQEFEVLKNAPRMETGAPVRIKPFGVEVRNVRCLRCGNYGHQSGDRECPMKDVIMPNEESRLKRDDPLTAIMAQTDSSEPLKWELKQKPGMSPPRGGFNPDDPNQQIVAEDIFDEYGGFLGDIDIPALLSNFSSSKSKKRSKSKGRHKHVEPAVLEGSERYQNRYHLSSDSEAEKSNRTSRVKRKKKYSSDSSFSDAEVEARKGKRKLKNKHKRKHRSESLSDSDAEVNEETRRHQKKEHRKKRREYSEGAPSSFSKDKGGTEGMRHSRRSRENWEYSDPSASESERYSVRRKEKQYNSDSTSARNRRHSRRSREKKYNSDSSSPDTNRHPRRSLEKQRHTDLSPHETDMHSRRSRGKQDYTESSHHESSRHARRSKEKRQYSDSSASDYSDNDRHSNQHETDKHSRRSRGTRDYTGSSHHESSRHVRRSREKRQYSDSSASD
ncbi:hypothetical protein ACP70R_043870 [Stipagrostis hirtigluma subsp. patula]